MLPLARFPVLHSADRDEVHQNIRSRFPGAHSFAVQGGNKDWSMRINSLNLGRGNVTAVASSGVSLSNSRDGIVRLYLPLVGGLEKVCGAKRRSIAVGQATFGPLTDFTSVFADNYRCVVLGFPQRLVEETLAEFGWQGNLAARLEQLFAVDDPAALQIGRHMLALVRTLDQTPEDLLGQKRFLTAQEELLLLQVAHGLAAQEGQSALTQGASTTYLTRAMDYMNAHLFEEIGPTSVARAAGCSLRNLQLLFQRDFGETITGRLRHLRLEAARDRLSCPQDQDTITSIAIDCGFSHLSDFARHYRTLYGERPSQTLARCRASTIS